MEKVKRRVRRSRSRLEFRAPGLRRTATTGLIVGAVLGCLFGALMNAIPHKAKPKDSEMLSVNQRTGRPQLHVKGKPEIPDIAPAGDR